MKRPFLALTLVAGSGLLALAMKIAIADGSSYKAIDPANFNTSVRPQDDFFEYANGNWIKKNPIPASETSWGNFNVLSEKSQKALLQICQDASKDKAAQPGTNQQRIGDFYASGMDSVAIDKAGFTQIQPVLDKINGVKDKASAAHMLGELHRVQVGAGFAFFVMADMKDSKKNAAYLFQSGLGLPEKEYYLGDAMQSIRAEYSQHLVKMFMLMGDDKVTAKANAEHVMMIETKLADSSMSAVESRDVERQYNKMTTAELARLMPNMDWNDYFKTLQAPEVKEVIVAQPAFMRQFNALLASVPADGWKAYYRWQFVHLCAPKLHSAVSDENFNFYGTVLSGQQKQQPRWKRVLATTEGALGEALGQLYVERHFSEESKQRVNVMVDNLIAAYTERIRTRDWMSDQTKDAAVAKLGTILRKLAFPDKWRDYTGLKVSRDSYVRNFLASNKFDVAYNLNKLTQPVDRMEWGMTPATINAYYNPTNNEIVFPAAIMQPPFFDPNADDAVNYGAMGAIIGHELTHGFDDQGALFDSEGNMVNWWTEEDMKNFQIRSRKLAEQFNQFVVIDSLNLHVNGELTLGENIADLGGLTIAYYAYKHSLDGKPAPPKIDGFTGEQRFFLSWAQGWRNSMRPKALVNMVKTNPHSPARFRVIGPLSNMQEFYDAFGVKEGDKMYRRPEDRVQIW